MDTVLRDKLLGKFIVFDGPDGCGKTTQLQRFADDLTTGGGNVTRTRDPGGTDIGERIRAILLGDSLNNMAIQCETLLFMASRAQLVSEVIAPALESDRTVLCDRFISSTCAYQGAVGHDIQQVIALGRAAVGDAWPDLTCVLDLPAEVGLQRARRRSRESAGSDPSQSQPGDAMEARSLDFHRRVREIFRQLPELYPKPVVIVDADGTVEEVYDRIIEALSDAGL